MEKLLGYTDNYNSLEEWIALRKEGKELVYPQFYIPYNEWLEDYIENINSKSDEDVRILLRILLQPFTLGLDSNDLEEYIAFISDVTNKENNPGLYEMISNQIKYNEKLHRVNNGQEAWEGLTWITEPSQALTLICDYEGARFYMVSISVEDLAVLDVPANLEWAMIVAYHRGRMEKIKGTPLYHKYQEITNNKDLIIGSIANDRMFFVIDNFFVGNITDAALVNSLSALELGKQYVAVTQKGCDAVRIEKEIPISYLERLFLKEVSAANRVKGSSLANDICKNYRREGLFFDEILDQAVKGGLANIDADDSEKEILMKIILYRILKQTIKK